MSTRFYVPRFRVRLSGITMAAEVADQVVSISYDSNLDMADMFTMVLRNPDNRLTDSPLFGLGKRVEIHMGYGDDLKPMMLGEITGVQPSFPESGSPTLTVTGYDLSHRLRRNQSDRPPFKYMNDSAIAAQIAVESGLVPVVDPSPFFHEYLQQTGTDMAFLKERARSNFFDVFVNWDRLYFRFPRPQTEAYVLEWGKNLSSFTPKLSSGGASGLQVVRGYNSQLAQTMVGIATAADLDLDDIVERLGNDVIDMLMSTGRQVIRDQPVESPLDAATLARSLLQQILDGMYEGSGSCIGIPELRADRFVAIRGVGKRFSGMYRLSRVTHSIDGNGYRTSFEATQRGHAALLPSLRRSVAERPSPERQEPVRGVAVGRVEDNVDPAGLGRVKLSFPWFSDDSESAWARCATPMAGSDRGAFFLPDVGDDVLVAFEHGDFGKPLVLGSLWNGTARPPVQHTDRLNRIRMIRTGAGHTITLDDTAGAEKIEIRSKSGLRLTLSDVPGTEKIELEGGGRRMVMSQGQINFY